MNGNICILKYINNISNPGSDSMHICNRNVYYEWVSMLHWTLWLIKINTFNLRTPMCKVACNKFPFIRTVTLLNTRRNEWREDFCSFREGFYWGGSWKKANIFVLVILNLLSRIVSEERLKNHQYSLVWEVYFGDEIQDVKPPVWLDQI